MSCDTAALDAEILALESKFMDLQCRETEARRLLGFVLEQKNTVERELSALKYRRYPIKWLPPELLTEIFLHFVNWSEEEVIHPPRNLVFHKGPVILSHVCHQWRELALSTSALWSLICVRKSEPARAFFTRSNQVPIDIIGTEPFPLSEGAFPLASARSDIRKSSSRWRSVIWSGTNFLEFLLELINHESPFPHLETLSLARDGTARGIPDAQSLVRPTIDALSRLSYLHLHGVAPSELPPVYFPALCTINLDFSKESWHFGHRGLRLSNLLPLLHRSQNLEQLFMEAVPLIDVYVEVGSGASGDCDIPPGSRFAKLQVKPIVLPHLRSFKWRLVPPGDMWLLFIYIEMPSLQELHLFLGNRRKQWTQMFEQVLLPSNSPPISGLQTSPVITLAKLEELFVNCRDAESLAALKKIQLPALRKLNMSRDVFSLIESSSPQLPRLESIFHDPRLPHLTSLKLIWFDLDAENTISMLRYMPSLTLLYIESCHGAGEVLCHLSGGSCRNSHVKTQRSWTCPRLTHLILTFCADVKFSCLSAVVQARKAQSMMAASTPESSASTTPARLMKPLKRRALQNPNSPVLSLPTPASPNGSFMPGWNSFGVAKPSSIISVHISGCRRVSKVEAMSLMEEDWGVLDISWAP
ncbi:hypothetical protein BKA93DRAFT_123759 [Sparassis latifolia]|uniref:Uncharacterized protein n=1 Tax=Sparassis crispa TaxID=139825 RepID=A0A401GNA7_9APHY|nr:hypothetical protein SCP_0507150 [Sparassis crispa]GBE83660.1 hypothetical protein SCP_0507150 [Sparassis crispa]